MYCILASPRPTSMAPSLQGKANSVVSTDSAGLTALWTINLAFGRGDRFAQDEMGGTDTS